MEPLRSSTDIGGGRGVDAVAGLMGGWIGTVEGVDALDGYLDRAAGVADVLVRGGMGGLATCRALTGLHDLLTVRLIRLAEVALGPPPCPYAWLALGSAGRMEQSLCTDQDHAIVYADGAAPVAYFAALGARVVAGLARAGLRRCPGGYMADRWHLPLAAWQEVFGRWVDRPEPQALVEAEVFLDFRSVCGGLSVTPLEAVLRRGCGASRFLVGMARAAVRFPPPLGFAGGVRSTRGEVDLKRGLAAAVLLARLYAVAAGSLARSTPQRLAAAARAGALSHSGAAALAEAYRFLTDLRLGLQLRQVAAGREPTNAVRLDDLATDDRRRLRRALHAVRDIQRVTSLTFRTDTVL